MKKIIALFAIVAFVGIYTAPALVANDQVVQEIVDQDQDKKVKKAKAKAKATKAASEEGCCSEAAKASECGSKCGSECESACGEKGEAKKQVKTVKLVKKR